MVEKRQVIEAIIEAATGAEGTEALVGDGVEEALIEAADEVFGGWTAALAASLVEVTNRQQRTRRSPKRGASLEDVERKITEAFENPFYMETADGRFFSFHGPDLEVSQQPQSLDAQEVAEPVRAIHYVGDSDAVYVFSDQGRFFGIDQRMIPSWGRRGERRSIRDILFLTEGEEIRAVVARRKMMTGRVIHITGGGKGKATDASEFGDGLDRSGRTAFKVRDGDVPVAVIGASRDTTIFCASAMGQGIHFDASELRSMGRKAIGVNVMKLSGDSDRVAAAFEGKRVRQIAVITAEGLGKRVDFSEFRTQGRNGKGMQLARLNPGDQIGGAVPCNPAEDVAVTTDKGRVWRLEAARFPMMGRSAKGDRMVELADDERIIDLTALPCGG